MRARGFLICAGLRNAVTRYGRYWRYVRYGVIRVAFTKRPLPSSVVGARALKLGFLLGGLFRLERLDCDQRLLHRQAGVAHPSND